MPKNSPHIICRQYLHVELNGTESDGLALQRRLSDLCRHWLIPALERVLERCTPSTGHLVIERLDLDVGTLAPEHLEQDLAEAAARALEKSLREQIPRSASSPLTLSGTVEHKTAQRALQDVLIYFLKTGSLPWSFRLPEGTTLEQFILGSWQEATASGLNPLTADHAFLQVLAEGAVRKRLVRQFSPFFLETLLTLLAPAGKKVMDTLLQTLNRAEAPSAAGKHFARKLRETVFARVAAQNAITATDLVEEARGALPDPIFPASTLKRDRLHANTNTSAAADGKSYKAPFNGRELLKAGIYTEPIPPRLFGSEKASSRTGEHPDAKEGIYIENAGLVLLHPFLSQFFEALGIAADKILLPDRALCLLHFLTTGQDIAPEYELVLPKILCNIPLQTSVETDLELSGPEKEEADALLKAVIRHWDVLQNTSPDGLRGTFLLRPGKVSERDDGDWLLQVESKAFDVLLEQLPWSIAMIKLPWMERMLWVEWR